MAEIKIEILYCPIIQINKYKFNYTITLLWLKLRGHVIHLVN
jgi:hypothetical protein